MPSPAASAPESLSDHDAIQAVIGGQREMFEVIVRRYNPLLYRLGRAYLKSHDLAEDAMQNAYLKAFLNLPKFQGTAAFSTWLTRIMINECLMLLRSRKQVREESWDENAPISFADPNVRHGSTNLNLEEMKNLLEQHIAELPRRHRAVYLLREVQQLSTAETAAALDLSVENVKVSLHRAKEALKARLLSSAAGVELFPYHAPYCNRMTARVMSAVRGTAPMQQ